MIMVVFISKKISHMNKILVFRSLLLTALLWLSCLVADAQIQRVFWGIELGRSTKSEVLSIIKNNGWKYELAPGAADAIFVNDKVSLGGRLWEPIFSFYDNILYDVALLIPNIGFMNGEITDEKESNTSEFYNLKDILNRKYSNVENIKDPTIPSNHVLWRDDLTLLTLMLDEEKNVSLLYQDRRLHKLELSGSGL